MQLNKLPALGLVVEIDEVEIEGSLELDVRLYDPQIDCPIDSYEARFVELRDEDEHSYIFAAAPMCPFERRYKSLSTHAEVNDTSKAIFKDSDTKLRIIGGGYIRIRGSLLELFGTSDKFGKFEVAKVEPVVRQYVQENMPYIKEISVQ